MKIWKIDYHIQEDKVGSTVNFLRFNGSSSSVSISFTLIAMLQIPATEGPMRFISYLESERTMAIVNSQNKMRMFSMIQLELKRCGKFVELKGHAEFEEHTDQVRSLSYHQSLAIFCTSANDGCLKIWDAKSNSLIRELELGYPISSAIFANAQADILIAQRGSIFLLRVNDYLPSSHIVRHLDIFCKDDLPERSLRFDSDQKFWEVKDYQNPPVVEENLWQQL